MRRPATRDDTIDLLNEVLKGRLRETFEKFCAEIPEILDGLQQTATASPEGGEFVRTLLAWVGGASRRSEQASRYFLMWYAKTLAGKSAHEMPDCRAVAELLRKHLRQDELEAVDQALADGWKILEKSRSLTELASRRRKEFLAWLTPRQKERFAPYLGAFVPAFAWPGLPMSAPRPDVGTPPTPAVSTPVGSWMASRVASAVIVAGLPLLAALGWYVVRGRTAENRGAPAAVGRPGALRALSDTREVAEPAPVITPPTSPAGVADAAVAVSGGRVLPAGGPSSFNWTSRISGTKSLLNGVAWSGSLAVAVGFEGTILSSEDGSTWKAAPQLVTYSYAAVTHGDGRFVAVGTSKRGTHFGRIISTSADGMSWTTQRWQERPGLTSIAYGSGTFVAIGNRGAIVRSADGESWQTVTSETSEHLDGISYINDHFVVIGHNGTAIASSNGVTWTLKQHHVSSGYFRAAFGNGIYLAVGQRPTVQGAGQAMVWLSTDLASWTEQEVSGATGFRNSAFANGRFVATGRAGGILTSADGLAWTVEVPAAAFPGEGDLLWTGSMLIAIGEKGALFTAMPASRPPSPP
jgi:hypothetical protein